MGVDIVDVARVERLVTQHGRRALQRLFTPGEIAYCTMKRRPAQHLAARLAAKEAAFKALSGSAEARLINWREIELTVSDDAPVLLLHGRAAQRAAAIGANRIWVSVTHDGGAAHATVLLEAAAAGNAR